MNLKEILSYAIHAPSGDNCQPWKFKIFPDYVDVYNDPSKDESLYNFQSQAAFIAHGTLLENIDIASRHIGYVPDFQLFPTAGDLNHIARVTFTESIPQPQELFPFITKRATNRKPYNPEGLTRNEIETLSKTPQEIKFAHFKFMDSAAGKKRIADAACVNEQVVLENKLLHQFLFHHIVWTQKEADAKREGMFVKTLEMPKPGLAVFKLASSWPRIQLLNKIGLSKIVSKQNGQIYLRSGAFGIIYTEKYTPENLVNCGRMLQHIWLQAAKMNISLHPVSGLVFLRLRLQYGNEKDFSRKHIAMINKAYDGVAQAFGLNQNDVPAFMFRLGKSQPPSANSPKLPLDRFIIP